MKPLILLTLCLAIASYASSSQQIYQMYVVSYDGATGRTSTSVGFKQGDIIGKPLQVDKIVHNGEALGHDTFHKMGFEEDHVFEMTHQGQRHVNKVKIPTFSFQVPSTIDRNQDLKVTWTGSPLSKNETISISVFGVDKRMASYNLAREGATEIVLPKEEMARLIPGAAQVEMERSLSLPPDTGNKDEGFLVAKYATAKKPVTITGMVSVAPGTPKIYPVYDVRYDGSSNRTVVTAKFLPGDGLGNWISIDEKRDQLLHNGEPLRVSGVAKNGFEAEHRFELRYQGETYSHTIKLTSFSFQPPSSVSRSQDLTVSWSGAPLARHEAMWIQVCDSDKRCKDQTQVQEGASSIVLEKDYLTKLKSGEGTLVMERSTSTGGKALLDANYKTEKKRISIRD